MYLKNLLLFSSILFMTSHVFLNYLSTSSSKEDKTSILQSQCSFFNSNEDSCFECEEFIFNALNNYTIAIIDKDFFNILNCAKESEANWHDSSVIDTVYTFSNPTNKIQIYRANKHDFIVTFDVTDSVFNLIGDVKPGMKKDIFQKKFHLAEIINNEVEIYNLEGNMGFVFYFDKNALKRIKGDLYLD
jgi:hypothetical protein